MVFKGFSASYVAVEPFEGSEEMNSDSSEMATPFPGYMKSVYVTKNENEEGGVDGEEDDDDHYYNEYDNYNTIKPTRNDNVKAIDSSDADSTGNSNNKPNKNARQLGLVD